MVDDAADFDPSGLGVQKAGHQVSASRIVRPFVNLEMHRPLGSSDQAPEAAQNLGPGRKEPNIIAFGDWQAVAFEPDPIPDKTTRRGSNGAPSSFRPAKQARLFYTPAMAAFRKERLSFGSDRFCKTENNF